MRPMTEGQDTRNTWSQPRMRAEGVRSPLPAIVGGGDSQCLQYLLFTEYTFFQILLWKQSAQLCPQRLVSAPRSLYIPPTLILHFSFRPLDACVLRKGTKQTNLT